MCSRQKAKGKGNEHSSLSGGAVFHLARYYESANNQYQESKEGKEGRAKLLNSK